MKKDQDEGNPKFQIFFSNLFNVTDDDKTCNHVKLCKLTKLVHTIMLNVSLLL